MSTQAKVLDRVRAQPTQRNYKFFGNKSTNFFAKVAEGRAQLKDYDHMKKLSDVYTKFCGKAWVEHVMRQSCDIVFNNQ